MAAGNENGSDGRKVGVGRRYLRAVNNVIQDQRAGAEGQTVRILDEEVRKAKSIKETGLGMTSRLSIVPPARGGWRVYRAGEEQGLAGTATPTSAEKGARATFGTGKMAFQAVPRPSTPDAQQVRVLYAAHSVLWVSKDETWVDLAGGRNERLRRARSAGVKRIGGDGQGSAEIAARNRNTKFIRLFAKRRNEIKVRLIRYSVLLAAERQPPRNRYPIALADGRGEVRRTGSVGAR